MRWNPVSRLTSKQVVVSSGYASETPNARASVEHERPTARSRTYSNSSRGKMSSAGGSQSGHGVAGSGDDFQMAVDRLLRLNTRTFAITGTVPLFAPITLFFQTPTGSCHLLRFPSESSIPSRSFDAFLAACEPVTSPIPSAHGRSASTAGTTPPTHHTFRSNPARPINTSFDIASHPILETVRRTLFPTLLAEGSNNYLVASLNRVDVFCPGASSAQPRGYSSHRTEGDDEPVAHIIVTLPVRFRGGMLSIAKDGVEEKFWGRGTLSAGSSAPTSGGFAALGAQEAKKISGSLGAVEWVAWMGNRECEQKIDKVEKGVRINLVYDVRIRGFGPLGTAPRALITPNDNLLAAVSSVLKRSRGMKLAFYLTNDYGISPSHVLADSLIPLLKGSDLALYHGLKFYNLNPSLRYTAGGFIWPPQSTATIVASPQYLEAIKRLALKSAGEDEDLSVQIEEGGGVPLDREGIVIATGKEQGKIGRERVAIMEARQSKLEYLHVNVCLVVYVH